MRSSKRSIIAPEALRDGIAGNVYYIYLLIINPDHLTNEPFSFA